MSRLIQIPFELPDKRSRRIAYEIERVARHDDRLDGAIITSRGLAERAAKSLRDRGLSDVTTDEIAAWLESCPDLPEEPERWDGLS